MGVDSVKSQEIPGACHLAEHGNLEESMAKHSPDQTQIDSRDPMAPAFHDAAQSLSD